MSTKKVPKNAYVLLDLHVPDKRYAYWSDNLPVPVTINWEKIHKTIFFSTIDTKLRSFYFKIFHRAIALNDFLFKIKRKESHNCTLCDKKEETMVHLFCDCEKVAPIWHDLLVTISQKCNSIIIVTNFEKLFGICCDKFVTFLFLLLKYHIYMCKFNNNVPNIILFKSFVKKQKEIEYLIAKKRNKLPAHFKKWRFNIWLILWYTVGCAWIEFAWVGWSPGSGVCSGPLLFVAFDPSWVEFFSGSGCFFGPDGFGLGGVWLYRPIFHLSLK